MSERAWRPSLLGAAYLLLLSGAALLLTLSDDHVQGVAAPSVRHLIATRFRTEVWSAALQSLGTALVLGLLLGSLAGVAVRLRNRLAGRTTPGPRRLALESLALLVLAHGVLFAHDVARHPQAHAASLYAHGGLRAALQVLLTDVVGARTILAIGAGSLVIWLVAPALRGWRAGIRWPFPRLHTGVVIGLGVAGLVAVSCSDRFVRRAHASSRQPNVLIIAADSLRADRLGPRTAPNLWALSNRGLRFEHAYTALPRTFPSWVSMLSGRDPHHHGIRHMFPRADARARDVGAIPKSFARAGYHTAVVSDFAGDIFRRMDLGFERARTPTFDVRELVREVVFGGQGALLPLLRTRTAARALPVLRELHDTTDPWAITADTLSEVDRAGDRPFFVTAFYSTTHFPYSAPEPFASRFLDRAYRGPFRYGKTPALGAEHEPDAADVEAVRASYDGAVAAVDDAAGELLAGLARRGHERDTIVVVTSDHGESLYEPGRGQGHGDHLFGDEGVHVPLVIADPALPTPRSVPDVVRSVDLAPTLCELCRVDCGPGADGRSLTPAFRGQPLAPRPAFAESGLWFTRDIPDLPASMRLPYPDLTETIEVSADSGGDLVARKELEPLLTTAKHRMVRDGKYKLVYAPTRGGPLFSLYDCDADPGETRDVATEQPAVVDRLKNELFRWMLEDPTMQRRGDYLVPRPREESEPGAVRVQGDSKVMGVALRLTDAVGTAMVDAPELSSVDRSLDYWRRMRSPWAGPVGELGRAVQQVSLVDKRGRRAKKGAKRPALALDPHVWNSSDGSFDQREAIFAPPPSRFRFRALELPRGAVLQTAPAILGAKQGGAELEIAVVADGARSVLGRREIDGSGHRFEDWRVDLSAWGGRRVELELVTRALAHHASPAVVWGSPVILAPGASDVPFNVLFIVVDAMRGDALSATHDPETDQRMARADPPPLDAWLPSMPTVAPNLDSLSRRGVLFTQAHSAATWTRPGTIAMLAGAPSGDLGIGALKLVPEPSDVRALYARRPPFLPLLLRPHGVFSDAVVNNFYMVGYSGVGIDMGFEALHDHRYAVEDTAEILANATAELEARRASRFFMFVNFNSPHVPYQPPKSAKAAVPRPPVGPRDHLVREYLAEIHKDDAAIGSLIEKLDELGLSRDTLVIVTADHGETLSEEHQIVPDGVDGGPAISGRFHHLSSLYDETAHVPLIMVLPDKLPRARKISDPISTIDIAPTLLDLAGLPVPDAVGGRSLLSLIGGKRDPERTLYVEGRGAHSIRVGRWLLLLRDAAFRHVRSKGRRYSRAVELYDLETDPGQRVDVAKRHPDVVARLTKLDAARGAHSRRPGKDAGDAPIVHLRFAGAGAKHRVTGTLSVAGDASLVVTPIGLPPTTILGKGATSELAFETEATASVGFDVRVEPPDAELTWTFSVDGRPLPKEATHAGGFGLFAPELATGLRDAAARRESAADESPFIDPERDFGLFVSRDRAGREIEIHAGTDAQQEAMGLMRAWGYVRGPAAPP